MIIRDCGDRGLLIDLDDADSVLDLARTLRAEPPAGVVDVVPAARTVLVVLGARADQDGVRRVIEQTVPRPRVDVEDHRVVTLDVVYDGPDLPEVARLTGLTPDEVVAAHTEAPWSAAFVGFAPGFAYLDDGDPRLDVPRRDEARARVPAGSVALAGGLSAVYPRDSPGGWRLIGRTDAVLWDLDRDPPALVRPGDTVRFRAVGR